MELKERKIIAEALEKVQQFLNSASLELRMIKENIDYNDVVFQKEKYSKED